MVTLPDVDLAERPACGEVYPAGLDCECGYCSHGTTPAGETCPICESWVGTVDDPVGELLDAADAMVAAMGDWPPFAWLYDEITRLRQAVTRLQGTAGLSVAAGGAA